MTEPLDNARLCAVLIALAEHGIPADIQALLVHGSKAHHIPPGALAKALYAAPMEMGPTAEDIRACAWSTLIGWQDELGDNIDFICDQIARKATLALPSAQSGGGA